MKIQIQLSIILLLTFSFIVCADRRSQFTENIREYAEKRTQPIGSEKLLYNFDRKLLFYFIH